MMNCENCGHELAGGAIICRECKHNNALRRVGETRARRVTAEMPEAPARRFPSFAAPTRTEGRTPPAKVQPIRPLAQTAPALVAEEELGLGQYPPWRAQLKEKVRQARERRQPDEPEREPAIDEAHLDPNPLVQSALKRLQRSDYSPTPTTMPRIVRRGAQAAALAAEDEFEPAPKPEPKPVPKPELKPAPRVSPPTNPLLPRRTDPFNDQHPAQPSAERPQVKRAEARDTKTLPPRPTTPSVAPTTSRAESKLALHPTPRDETKIAPQVETKREAKLGQVASRITLPTADKRPSAALFNPPTQRAPAAAPAAAPVVATDAPLATPPSKPIATQIIGLTPAVETAPEPELPPFFLAPARDAQTATLWVRTLAGACDFEVVCASYLPLFASYATLDTSLGRESLAIMVLLLATITFCYQLLTLNIAGRTFGMAMLNLHLINRDDEMLPPTRRQRFIRALGATVAFLCPPLNLLATHLNREHRSLPDLCSRTTIIES